MKLRIASAWHTLAVLLLLGGAAQASMGDRLPDFKDCVQVRVDGVALWLETCAKRMRLHRLETCN